MRRLAHDPDNAESRVKDNIALSINVEVRYITKSRGYSEASIHIHKILQIYARRNTSGRRI